jgi:hypothetical protein
MWTDLRYKGIRRAVRAATLSRDAGSTYCRSFTGGAVEGCGGRDWTELGQSQLSVSR